MPIYKHAAYSGETITLDNGAIRLEMHKRPTGWGWGEIFSADGKCMGVLDHLGELLLRDQEIPMRLEAGEVVREKRAVGEVLTFKVESSIVKEKLKGTSFEPWLNYPLDLHCMTGEVTITMPPKGGVILLSYRLLSKANQYARYVRGPWLKVGEGTFGAQKTDAILPGVEWLVGEEWSSGTDWFKDPWAMRSVPHPFKVAIPVMAASYEGTGIGLAWNPNQVAAAWFNLHRCRPQPVFASPNFIDRMNNHLMGLMVPDVEVDPQENQVYREPPLELHLEQRIEFDAEIFLVEGNSLDVISDWVIRHGLPEPPAPRWPFEEALDTIASAYNTNFWHEGKGFGTPQTPGSIGPHVPGFVEGYFARRQETPLVKELRAKVAWCQAAGASGLKRVRDLPSGDRVQLLEKGKDILSQQREDGSFPFDPQGRHYRKDDFVVASTYIEPMAHAGETALDITILPALQLLTIYRETQDVSCFNGARKALDYCLPMQRPEGGDYWETPLHSPNLLAAGHAAVAYYLGYQLIGEAGYKAKAVHWIRSLLPFTHLWEPRQVPQLYNTKPCLCSSDWYFANWVRDHVQWEVLETFVLSVQMGIDWAVVDPEIDWDRYHQGITIAVMRWMLDHNQDEKWRPHNLPWTLDQYRQGLLDTCFADTHNSTTGNYGGAAIMPDVIALNILAILAKK